MQVGEKINLLAQFAHLVQGGSGRKDTQPHPAYLDEQVVIALAGEFAPYSRDHARSPGRHQDPRGGMVTCKI